MKTAFKSSFSKDLRKISDQRLLRQIQKTIEQVELADTLDNLANLKKLQGRQEYYRLRIGDYRIGLAVADDLVTFVRVLHRKDIYRYFP